jgi:hypothetical protein
VEDFKCLEVPFKAPRQLGVVGGQQGGLSLPSVGWRTGQSGAPPDSHCSYLVRDLLPILAPTIVADSWQLAHRTLSDAHRTVRCPLPTVGSGHASPADCEADRCSGGRWLTGQSGELYSYAAKHSREWPCSPEASLAHRTVWCARLSWTSAVHSQVTCNLFLLFFSLFLALRQHMLVLKTMY